MMAALRQRYPDCAFAGVGGEAMAAQGLNVLVDIDRLAINGFVEPLRRLPDLIAILRSLRDTFAGQPPDVFVGVDFNVFNLMLEARLKRLGIPTVHYVSPSVYAWRRGRVRRVARSADMLLALFPFEPAFYRGLRLQVVYVGHPLADEIALDAGSEAARRKACEDLHVPADQECVALLPGSRLSEVRLMAPVFFAAAREIARVRPAVTFVVPCVRPEIAAWLEQHADEYAGLSVLIHSGNARQALTACHAALVKSGTSTLEAMLLRRPMVVSYKLGELSYQVIRRMVRSPYIALPNILADAPLVPELIQHAARPQELANKIVGLLDKGQGDAEYLAEFAALHVQLRQGADERAASAVAGWFGDRGKSE
jgi:lipid-A-disaccharide synthase